MIIYTIDSDGIYSGSFFVTDQMAPVPNGVGVPPPALQSDEVARWSGAGWDVLPSMPVPVITPEQIIAEVTAATQKRLDDFARTRNYDGILSACTYATSSMPKFTAEGQYAVDVRDNTWATLYAIMGEVQAGTRPMPTGFADIEADLPVLAWPA